ncbi:MULTISPECIES: DUF2946 family protein [Ramlibacter]|uniref:DUF2946 family protein n=1 Tax=Ramlibacter pinisoli TaxID=2682844 RepID=A0A6N8J2K2_9BURK|nr:MULTISPECIES: DUF2946 family protein [Ramlibacter]MBA2963048.1 DUF2946 family protein [Ramlibacter sp. CGMCC 1.13660]MVQ32992.1 DUF2946 family protein [Ramlibacter pinisoli]
MDDIVRQAMAKWPNVPHCFGWLGLDARGNWYMRDDRTQAAGPFPQARGSLLRHEKLVDFIHRNYERDDDGCWFFQNGPQRVYVELEAAPFVLRLSGDGTLTTHTGRTVACRTCLLDDHGRLFVDTESGLGLLHTLDMHVAADLVESGGWKPEPVEAASLPARFGFVPSPQARANEKAGR